MYKEGRRGRFGVGNNLQKGNTIWYACPDLIGPGELADPPTKPSPSPW